jgi:hypothetical protein
VRALRLRDDAAAAVSAPVATGDALAALQALAPPWAQHPILVGVCGSDAHGTKLPPDDPHATDDLDIFAVTVQSPEFYLGVSALGHGRQDFNTNGQAFDITGHDARKFIGLLGKGNPNVHSWLWSPELLYVGPGGALLVAARERLLSKALFPALFGYAMAQLKKMLTGERSGYMGAKRKELLRQYGYDIKDASHCVRLLHVGLHLARTGELMVRLSPEVADEVKAIKGAHWTVREVERRAEALFAEFRAAEHLSQLRDEVPVAELDALCVAVLLAETRDNLFGVSA